MAFLNGQLAGVHLDLSDTLPSIHWILGSGRHCLLDSFYGYYVLWLTTGNAIHWPVTWYTVFYTVIFSVTVSTRRCKRISCPDRTKAVCSIEPAASIFQLMLGNSYLKMRVMSWKVSGGRLCNHLTSHVQPRPATLHSTTSNVSRRLQIYLLLASFFNINLRVPSYLFKMLLPFRLELFAFYLKYQFKSIS